MVCSCISGILEAFLVCVGVGGGRKRRGEWGTCSEASVLLQAGVRTLVNVHMGTSKSLLPLPHTSAPGEHRAGLRGGERDTPRQLYSFFGPSPRAFSRRSLAECVPWNPGPLLPLQLMLLCSVLNEARTFTQVTFIIPLSRTLSCAPRAVSAGKEELSRWSIHAGLEWGDRFLDLSSAMTVSLGMPVNFCGLQFPSLIQQILESYSARPCSQGWECGSMRARCQPSRIFHSTGAGRWSPCE